MIRKRELKDGGVSFLATIRIRKNDMQVCESQTFETEKDALAWEKDMRAKIRLGLFDAKSEGDRLTFAQAVERYREQVLPKKRAQRQDNYKFNTILKNAAFKNLVLSKVSAVDIAKYRDMRLKDATDTTVSHELALISHVFSVAIKEWGFIKLSNPIQQIKKPGFNRSRDRRLFVGEIDYVLASTESEALKTIVPLALETAMREAELAGLKWEDFDMKSKVVTLEMTKNGEKRVVPLSPTAFSILSALPRPIGGGPIFDMTPHAVAAAFRRAVARARKNYEMECEERGTETDKKFLVGLHFHDLRHEATSRFIERGLSISEVSQITGHKTLQMLKRYTHISPAHLVQRLAEQA